MKPHIKFDSQSGLWWAMLHRWATRPVLIAHSFELLCEAMRRSRDRSIALRNGTKMQAKWYDFKAKHDID